MYTQYVYWINENKELLELYTNTVNTIIIYILYR